MLAIPEVISSCAKLLRRRPNLAARRPAKSGFPTRLGAPSAAAVIQRAAQFFPRCFELCRRTCMPEFVQTREFQQNVRLRTNARAPPLCSKS